MAVIITGVGYIGSALLQRVLDSGEEVVGLDNAYSTSTEDLLWLNRDSSFTLLQGDVAERDDVKRAFDAIISDEPITVYHLAAQPSAAVAVSDPEYTERANLVGARILLEEAKDRGARVVFGGSFRVYGDDLNGRDISEQTPYGRMTDLSHLSKIWVEQLARMVGLPFISARLGVVYGIGPIMKDQPQFMTVPHLFAQRAVKGLPLGVLTDRPIAFIHLEDAVDALLLASDIPEDDAPWQVANAVSEVLTVGELALLVKEAAETRGIEVEIEGETETVDRFTYASQLVDGGFTARRNMKQTVGELLDYFRERAD